MSNVLATAPGIAGAAPQPFGDVAIAAPCAPQKVAGTSAFLLPCGGTLTSRRQSPVQGIAYPVDGNGNPQGSPQPFTLTLGQSFVLPTPATGQQWLVEDMTAGQASWMIVWIVGGAAAATGFAAYGVVEFIEHLVRRHQNKTQQRRAYREWRQINF